jgi:hypothetical protein
MVPNLFIKNLANMTDIARKRTVKTDDKAPGPYREKENRVMKHPPVKSKSATSSLTVNVAGRHLGRRAIFRKTSMTKGVTATGRRTNSRSARPSGTGRMDSKPVGSFGPRISGSEKTFTRTNSTITNKAVEITTPGFWYRRRSRTTTVATVKSSAQTASLLDQAYIETWQSRPVPNSMQVSTASSMVQYRPKRINMEANTDNRKEIRNQNNVTDNRRRLR